MVVAGAIDLTALGFVAMLRVVWVLTFLAFHPFVVHIVNFNLDSLDFGVAVHLELTRDQYDRVDKTTDLVYYLGALVYLLVHWRDLWYARYCVPFLAFRIAGNVLFIASLEYAFLIVFANIFQLLFFVYTFLDLIQVDAYLRDTPWLNGLVIGLVAAVKWALEGVMHGDIDDEEQPVDDDATCRCDTGWEWIGDRAFLLVAYLILALYIVFTRSANYSPARSPVSQLKSAGWDLKNGGGNPFTSPYNIGPKPLIVNSKIK